MFALSAYYEGHSSTSKINQLSSRLSATSTPSLELIQSKYLTLVIWYDGYQAPSTGLL
jgi:hypothetical protein